MIVSLFVTVDVSSTPIQINNVLCRSTSNLCLQWDVGSSGGDAWQQVTAPSTQAVNTETDSRSHSLNGKVWLLWKY